MMAIDSVWALAAAATVLKMLLMNTYRSTDFEVHRNWLAITHSLPRRKWYIEDTSEWTLDYPPLFAAFEWCLSQIAQFVDKKMLQVENLNYASQETVLFQRLSVIFTDFVYFYAVSEFFKNSNDILFGGSKKKSPTPQPSVIIPALLIFNFGLFIVDHIHFQYNGILFGIFLLSIVRIMEGKEIEGSFWFAVLLNMKHIFMYVAPAYFVYLLRAYCFQGQVNLKNFSLFRFLKLGAIVIWVFLISFGPFIYFEQMGQVLSRLFPFKRGLMHAYWAPNFWALYSFTDKILTIIAISCKLVDADSLATAAMTGGMVQEYNFTMLPNITPPVTLGLTVLLMMPSLYILWLSKEKMFFVRTVILCAFTSFLFGWHVHEKAVLLIIVPMTLLVFCDRQFAKIYMIISVTGHFSLFPLLFTPFENVLKVVMFLQVTIYSFWALHSYHKSPRESLSWFQLPFLNLLESLYIMGLLFLFLFNTLGLWALGLSDRLPFLPLLLTSVYCAVGVTYSWLLFYASALTALHDTTKKNS